MDCSLTKLGKFADHRGFLVEFLKNSELPTDGTDFGQIYLTTIKPGCFRGNHFHRQKTEYFALVSGRAVVKVEDVNTGERAEYELTAEDDTITRIRVGPGVAHVIANTGDTDIVLCSYTNVEYDPEKLDQESYELT